MNAAREITHITDWTKDWYQKTARPGAKIAIGVSGGKDSTVTLALLCRALGPENIIGVLMPDTAQADIQDSYRIVKALGVPYMDVNIGPVTNALYAQVISAAAKHGIECCLQLSRDTLINTPPRIRMATLYAIAQSQENGGFVVNTCNRSEDYIAYSTKYGDAAGDFSLLADYLVDEVIEIGLRMPEIPRDLVRKVPADGLCGKTDEDRIGFSYAVLDRYLRTGQCDDPGIVKKIEAMHAAGLHKYRPMPYCQRSAA